MISVWSGNLKANGSSTYHTVPQFMHVHVTALINCSVNNSYNLSFFSIGAESHTHIHICTCKISMVQSSIAQYRDWVNGSIFPPLVHMRNLSVFTKPVRAPVRVCVEVWISHLQTLWFIRSIFAYAHNVINCHALSFRLATSPHAFMLAHPHTPSTWACTRWHAHTFTHSHTNSIGGEMMKGNSKPHSQLKTLWNTVFFSFTYSQTVAVSEPFRLSQTNMFDFIYGQSPSLGPVAQVKLSICLHRLVSHTQLLCTEAPWAIINYSKHHLDAVIICQSISLTPTEPGDMGGQIEWFTHQAAGNLCMCVCAHAQLAPCVLMSCGFVGGWKFSGINRTSIHTHILLSPL